MKKKILSIGLIIMMLLGAMLALTGCGNKEDKSNESNNKEKGKIDDISGYSYVEKTDDSLLDLKKDGTFKYYQDKDELTDYYYEGTYTIYNGEDAIEYIANDLENYGVTEEEQRDLLERNSKYKLDNYYCVVLKNKKCIIDGENTLTTTMETPYFGFYFEDTEALNITNMKSANIYNFIKEK